MKAVRLALGRVWLAAFLLPASFHFSRAEAPVLEDFHPAGAARGSTNTVTLKGKFEPWPPKLWMQGSGVEWSFETNKGKVEITVTPDAESGPRLLRIFNDEGASEPRFFVVGEGAEIGEAEPNDHFLKPQKIEPMPVCVNGRLEKRGDVDSYRIALKGGEWLDARLENYVLMGKVDGVLRLVTEGGEQLCWNHDFGSLDPRLIWRAPHDQEVILQVFGFAYPANAQIQLTGGDGGAYRLHLETRGSAPEMVRAERCETEPNDSGTEAGEVVLGNAVSGIIRSGSDEDRFRFQAEKEQFYSAEVKAWELGSELDGWLRIEDTTGKELARNDDAEGTVDSKLEWKAPSDGEFVVAIGSVTHRGGETYGYELMLRKVAPDFRARMENSSLVLKRGTTNEIKVKMDYLGGFTNVLEVRVEDLPAGVVCAPETVTKSGEAVLKLAAANDAQAGSGPIQVKVKDPASNEDRIARVEFISRSVDNGVPGGYQKLLIEGTEDFWLTVTPAEVEKAKEEGEKKQE